jgi:CsoR family transcriptional regulator, copper-sensing transcriptional repressor
MNHDPAPAAAAATERVRFTSSNLLTWSVCYRISTVRGCTAATRYGQHDVPSLATAEFPIDVQTPSVIARRHTPHGYAGQIAREGGQAMAGYVENKDEYLKRLRRIEGQVRGLQRMVADDTYCIDVLTQVSAATKALQSVALGLLDEHMSHCLVDAARVGGVEQDAKLKEASEAIARLVRS